MTHLFCSLTMMIYWYTQKDPLIHLWGIKVMTDERRDEGVCWGGRGHRRSIPRDPHGFLKMLFLTRENPACSAQATHSPSLLTRYNQPPPPPTPCAHGHPQSTWNWRRSLQEWTSTPLPLSPHNVERVQWTHFVTQLLRERLCVCVFGWLSGSFGFLPAFNLFLFFSFHNPHWPWPICLILKYKGWVHPNYK